MKCPYCGQEGAVVEEYTVFGPEDVPNVTIYCNKCRKETIQPSANPFFVKQWNDNLNKNKSRETWFKQAIEENKEHWKDTAKRIVSRTLEEDKKEDKILKVSYKGMTGTLRKLERFSSPLLNGDCYTLEISDENDGHKHVFENVVVSEIKFIGATVTME